MGIVGGGEVRKEEASNEQSKIWEKAGLLSLTAVSTKVFHCFMEVWNVMSVVQMSWGDFIKKKFNQVGFEQKRSERYNY